jgi:GR25 family glycosyltransferase involved in LPS biosynthesis
MQSIDAIYYINLDHRTDRNEQFLQEIEKINFPINKVTRISGVYNKELGALGCSLSHIKVLKTFLNSSYSNCIIFEDDFTFTTESDFVNDTINKILTSNLAYDIIMLSANCMYCVPTSESPLVYKVYNASTSSGYMITKEFAKILLNNIEESALLLEDHYNKTNERHHEYCLDQYFKKLQPISNWYVCNPKLGKQKESYSDNEYRIVDYNC